MLAPTTLLLLITVVVDEAPDQLDRLTARTQYAASLASLEQKRKAFAARYQAVRPRQRKKVLAEARAALLDAVWREILPAWYGTTWAMGGHTAVPGTGKIACGVFVGTILRHAGFRLNRIRMGQLASEHIALSLAGEKNLRRYRNKRAADVAADVARWGPGLYVVGLDYHAGLIYVHPEHGARFIHSSYVGTGAVVSETLLGDNPFAVSRYRVVAKLLDDTMLRAWISARFFEARD